MDSSAETRSGGPQGRGLIRLGLSIGRWVASLAPVAGLILFWSLPFKPAVTLYVVVVGLGIVLLEVVESARVSLEMEDIVRRQMDEYYAR